MPMIQQWIFRCDAPECGAEVSPMDQRYVWYSGSTLAEWTIPDGWQFVNDHAYCSAHTVEVFVDGGKVEP